MIWAVVKKELKEYLRDGRTLTLALLIIGLGSAALVQGRSSVASMERERLAASRIDRQVWKVRAPRIHIRQLTFRATHSDQCLRSACSTRV